MAGSASVSIHHSHHIHHCLSFMDHVWKVRSLKFDGPIQFHVPWTAMIMGTSHKKGPFSLD